jgi:hypothetical protein
MAHKSKLTKRKISFPRGKHPKIDEFASAPAACPSSPVFTTPVSVSSKLPNFNEYGSNLTCSPSFGAKLAAVASPASPSPPSKKPISLVSVSSQDEGEEVCNFIAEKACKLSEAERQEIGWESPDDWEFENETLAERCKKLNLRRPFQKVSDDKKKALMREAPVFSAASKGKSSVPIATTLEATSPSSKISRSGPTPSKLASTPSSSARCSARTQGSKSESILQKVVRVTVEKNAPGMPTFPSHVSYEFVLLSSRYDAHLLAVAADVGLAINPSVGSPEELLSLVRAKEVAQTLLAAPAENNASLPPEGAGVASPQSTEVGAKAAPTEPAVSNTQVGVAVATPPWFMLRIVEGKR